MPYYEMITEPGTNSVMYCEDDAEALSAAQAHHLRATGGEPGGPAGQPSERVVKLLKYDKHPADYVPTTEQLKADLEAGLNAMGDDVTAERLSAYIRDAGSPVAVKERGHDSQFKMSEAKDIWTEPKAGGK